MLRLKIKIYFPKSRRAKIFNIKLTEGMNIEDIAYQIAEQMYAEQLEKGIRVRDKQKWIDAQMRWLVPRVLSTILERLGDLLEKLEWCYREAYYSPTPWTYISRCKREVFEEWVEEQRKVHR